MKKEFCDFCGGKLPRLVTVQKNDRVRCFDCFSQDEEYKRNSIEKQYSKKNLEDWK